MLKNFVITVDGTAYSGKSSVSQRLAEIYSILHISSGWIYRAYTYVFFYLHKKKKRN